MSDTRGASPPRQPEPAVPAADGAAPAAPLGEHLLGVVEEQMRRGAAGVEEAARAVQAAASRLQHGAPPLAGYVQDAATALDGLARGLREQSPGDLLGRVQDAARRQPIAFFGAAVLAGFALARAAGIAAAAAEGRSPAGAEPGRVAEAGRAGQDPPARTAG